MSQLAQAGDARLALAAGRRQDGQVIQFLAGAPELLARYRNAPPAAAALIRRRDGCPPPGHGSGPAAGLPGSRRAGIPDRRRMGRARRGLAGTGPGLHRRPVQGGPRAADPHPPPPGQAAPPATAGTSPPARLAPREPLYRLADYLDQHGRAHRASQIPPAEFWSAAAAHAAPGDQAALGDAADDRGLYRDAAQLHKNAAASGNLSAALYLSQFPGLLACRTPAPRTGPSPTSPSTTRAAWPPAEQPAGGGRGRAGRRAAGARDPPPTLALDDPGGVALLLDSLREAGADEQAAALAARAAAHAALDDPCGVASCWLLASGHAAGRAAGP